MTFAHDATRPSERQPTRQDAGRDVIANPAPERDRLVSAKLASAIANETSMLKVQMPLANELRISSPARTEWFIYAGLCGRGSGIGDRVSTHDVWKNIVFPANYPRYMTPNARVERRARTAAQQELQTDQPPPPVTTPAVGASAPTRG